MFYCSRAYISLVVNSQNVHRGQIYPPVLPDREPIPAYVRSLRTDRQVSPAAENHYAIRWAAAKGKDDLVNDLLKDSRVDPAAKDNEAIRVASENGHVNVVRTLLEDERVDPFAQLHAAARGAQRNGHIEVELILRLASLLKRDHEVTISWLGLIEGVPGDGGRSQSFTSADIFLLASFFANIKKNSLEGRKIVELALETSNLLPTLKRFYSFVENRATGDYHDLLNIIKDLDFYAPAYLSIHGMKNLPNEVQQSILSQAYPGLGLKV